MTVANVEAYMSMCDSPTKIVRGIRQGNCVATKAFCYHINDSDNRACLVQAGAVDVLLEFLQRCDSHTIEQVLPHAPSSSGLVSLWITSLANTAVAGTLPPPLMETAALKILRTAESLAQCMSGLSRLLFRNHATWLANLEMFSGLLRNLSISSSVVTCMADCHEITKFLAQVSCLRVHQPDICHELAGNLLDLTNPLLIIERGAATALQEICGRERAAVVDATTNMMNVERLRTLARLDAGSKRTTSNAPENEEQPSLSKCLLKVISAQPQQEVRDSLFYVLLQCITADSCVSFEGVPNKLIRMGMKTDVLTEDALSISLCMNLLLMPIRALPAQKTPSLVGSRNYTYLRNDERFAAAMKVGLFELCLKLQAQFGHHEWNGTTHLDDLLDGCGSVTVSRFSSKVLVDNGDAIKEMAESYASFRWCADQGRHSEGQQCQFKGTAR